MKEAFGIDLGTTYSAIAYSDEDGNLSMIPNRYGEYLTPSAVYLHPDEKQTLVGREAKERSKLEPDNVIQFVKREMGKDKSEVRWDKREEQYNPYKFHGRIFSPEEISAFILRHLKEEACSKINRQISQAVVTVPAYFGTREKEATKAAGKIADLDVIELIPEPTAIALVHGACSPLPSEKVLVFDLGGGTFDITILSAEDGQAGKRIETIATGGDRMLGGKDWDDRLLSYAIEYFDDQTGVYLPFEKKVEAAQALANLRLDVETTKIRLSSEESASITVSYGGKSIDVPVDRAKFRELTLDLNEKALTYCQRILGTLHKEEIGTFILAGSMSNCPMIKELAQSWFGRPVLFGGRVNPKTAVALGAALQAHVLLAKLDGAVSVAVKLPQSSEGYDVLGDSAKLEAVREREKSAPPISGMVEWTVNVIPRTLGVIAKNSAGAEIVAPIIPANTKYPVVKSVTFGASADFMREIIVRVVEGESQDPRHTDSLGSVRLQLDGTIRRMDPIQLSYSFDLNGILKVEAKEVRTGNTVTAVIERKGKLSDAEVASSASSIGEYEFML
jgi:molecular chaperone DnaK